MNTATLRAKITPDLVLLDEFQYMLQESDAIAQRLNLVMENIAIEDEDNYWTEMTVNFRDIFHEFLPIKIAKKYAEHQ